MAHGNRKQMWELKSWELSQRYNAHRGPDQPYKSPAEMNPYDRTDAPEPIRVSQEEGFAAMKEAFCGGKKRKRKKG